MAEAPSTRLPLRVAVGVGIVAASTLALQVLLTRLFAAVLLYHFAFLAISLALLGIGAGAILVYVRPAWFERGGVERSLARWSAILAVPAARRAGGARAARVRGSIYVRGSDAELVFSLGLTALISALPFLAAGIVIAIAVKHYVGSIGRLYAFDLLGAGAGAVAMVPLLWLTDPATLIGATGGLAGIAVALFAWPVARWRWAGIGARRLRRRADGDLARLVGAGRCTTCRSSANAIERWSPLSRLVALPPRPPASARRPPTPPSSTTRTSPTSPSIDPEEGYSDWRPLQLGPQSIGYELTGPGDALIIGGGGGRDIHNALSQGQRQRRRDRAQPRHARRWSTRTWASTRARRTRSRASTPRSATAARRSRRATRRTTRSTSASPTR